MKASVKGILGLSENRGNLAVPMWSSDKKQQEQQQKIKLWEFGQNWAAIFHIPET